MSDATPHPFEDGFIPHPDEIFRHAHDFEKLIARVYEHHGHQICETRGERKRELGADFVAEMNGRRIAVQVKCSAKSRGVGVLAVRQASNARDAYKVHEGHVVTNSDFTAQARKEARQLNVRLVPRRGLLGWLSQLDLAEMREFQRIDKEAERLRRKIASF